ncbi:hypothetical protein ACVL5V_005706 [Bradyrhizobium ottawaense]
MTDLPTRSVDLKAVLSGSSPTVAKDDHSEGMSYLQSVPRRMVTLYLPLAIIVIVLLFPFYWMALTSVKPDEQLLDLDRYNPFWTWNPTFKHFHKLLFESYYPYWLWNTMYVAVCATVLSIIASVLAAYAIVRLRYKGANLVGGLIFLAYLVPPSILFIPLATVVFQYGLFDSPLALILTYPTIPDPVLDLALDGLFQDHPVRARGMRADRRGEPLADPDQDRSAARNPRADLGLHLLLHAVLERVHLRVDLPAVDQQQDGAGRDRQRVRGR